jgi:hypothetical protein
MQRWTFYQLHFLWQLAGKKWPKSHLQSEKVAKQIEKKWIEHNIFAGGLYAE